MEGVRWKEKRELGKAEKEDKRYKKEGGRKDIRNRGDSKGDMRDRKGMMGDSRWVSSKGDSEGGGKERRYEKERRKKR